VDVNGSNGPSVSATYAKIQQILRRIGGRLRAQITDFLHRSQSLVSENTKNGSQNYGPKRTFDHSDKNACFRGGAPIH
jgi:hypothetical protein